MDAQCPIQGGKELTEKEVGATVAQEMTTSKIGLRAEEGDSWP